MHDIVQVMCMDVNKRTASLCNWNVYIVLFRKDTRKTNTDMQTEMAIRCFLHFGKKRSLQSWRIHKETNRNQFGRTKNQAIFRWFALAFALKFTCLFPHYWCYILNSEWRFENTIFAVTWTLMGLLVGLRVWSFILCLFRSIEHMKLEWTNVAVIKLFTCEICNITEYIVHLPQ